MRQTISEMPPLRCTPEKSCLGIPVRCESISCIVTPLSMSSSIKPHSMIKSRILVDHLISLPLSAASVLFEMSNPTEKASTSLLFDAIANTESGVIGELSALATPYAPNSWCHPVGEFSSWRTTATESPLEFHFVRSVWMYFSVLSDIRGLSMTCAEYTFGEKGTCKALPSWTLARPTTRALTFMIINSSANWWWWASELWRGDSVDYCNHFWWPSWRGRMLVCRRDENVHEHYTLLWHGNLIIPSSQGLCSNPPCR